MARLLPEARDWTGVLYRSTSPAYAASRDLVSGAGALRHGGRWSSPGGCAAVYGSLTPEIAMAEALEHYRYYGLDPWQMGRRVFCPLRVKASAVLDLTEGGLRRRLRVSLHRMRVEDWRSSMAAGRQALTQAIGDAAFEAGLEGLVVPSKPVAGGANLVLFPTNLRSPGRILELKPRR
jgi:RES domain-containing protein